MGIELSFVIPAYNEDRSIGNVIDSIQKSIASLNYEIIVIDNGSTDKTVDIAESLGAQVHSLSRHTVSYARNRGAEMAKAEVIAFLDADVRITTKWGEEIIRKLDYIRTGSVLTGSRYAIPDNPTRIERDWFLPLSMKDVSYVNGGNLVLGKETFVVIGGFDESMVTAEDYEFSMRANRKGIVVENNPRLEAIHDGYPKDITEFIGREFWHGKGDCQRPGLFIKSKVSIASVLFGMLHVLLLGALFCGFYVATSIIISLVILASAFMSFSIFSKNGKLLALRNTPLCYLYLMSRFVSFLAVISGLRNR